MEQESKLPFAVSSTERFVDKSSFKCYALKMSLYFIIIISFAQSLQLSQTALQDTAPGKLVNLLSNDVNRFEIASIFVHPMWTSLVMTSIATYILWIETRWAGMFGLLIVFLIVPIQSEFF